tara:strand:+ start:307 stop:1257 length:951 start_codon:yes stop_codon:yes gene_type:complete
MNIILGTMNFGPQVDKEDSRVMVEKFLQLGYSELDTAYVYNHGDTERILGNYLNTFKSKKYSIATKIHPRITGKLDAEAISAQFEESLDRMNLSAVDILYFHFPDPVTPIEGALEKCAEMISQGKFKELGLSNFPAWMVVDIWHLCDKLGFPRPSVYQGMYNGLCRNVEPELIPALRKLGIRFYAYNPLAGGLLTGKHHRYDDVPQAGRFARLKSYRTRYWKQQYFNAVNDFTITCNEAQIKPAEAAYRWLTHHSELDSKKGDAIIIGASSLSQFEQNIESISQGPLPENIVRVFDNAWDNVLYQSPDYFKFFTKL